MVQKKLFTSLFGGTKIVFGGTEMVLGVRKWFGGTEMVFSLSPHFHEIFFVKSDVIKKFVNQITNFTENRKVRVDKESEKIYFQNEI